MLVKDIMEGAVRSVKVDTPMIEVASLMCLYRFSGLPVTDDENKLIGIVSEKDVLDQMLPSLQDLVGGGMASIDMDDLIGSYKDVLKLTVEEIMTKGAISVSPETHVMRAAAVMARNKFRRIPVGDAGELVGMISLGDVHKAIYQANISGACDT